MEEAKVKKSLFVRVFEVVIRLILKFRVFILIAIAAVTVFFAYELFSLQIDANIFSFTSGVPPAEYVPTPSEKPEGEPLEFNLPEDFVEFIPEQYRHVERPESEKLHIEIPEYMREGKSYPYYGDGFVVVFSSAELYTPEVLNLLYDVMIELESLDKVGPCLSPFDFVTVEKKGSRLSITPMSPVQRGEEWTEETAAILKERLMNDDMARNYLYSKDGNTIMLYYRTQSYNQAEQDVMNSIIDPLRDYGRVAINGGSSIINRVTYFIFKDLGILLSLCFIVILLVYYLSYRSLRAVIIPSSLSIIGIIWTLGMMSLMGYKLTIVSILTPCLVLTLGSSYSVHMLSEYFAEAKDPEKAVNGYARISKTILSACLTTIMGFITMLVCRTDMFKQFGVSVSIGIAMCAVLAILYLPSILSLLPQPKAKKVEKNSKVVFVDDGSKDNTWNIIEKLNKDDNLFVGVKLSRNKGHQNALLAGLMYAKDYCDITISMDADLQDDINVIDKMIEENNNGSEIVYGVRSSRKKDTFFKRFTAQSFYKIMKLFGVDIVYNHADCRLMSKRTLNELENYKEVNLFLRGLVPLLGFKTSIVYYERNKRFAGESKYPLKKMLSFAFEGITSFSTKPLSAVLGLGVIILLISIIIMIYSLIVKILGNTVSGWTFIVISIWFLGGIQMISIGILGKYIGKTYIETKARPKYIIEKVTER